MCWWCKQQRKKLFNNKIISKWPCCVLCVSLKFYTKPVKPFCIYSKMFFNKRNDLHFNIYVWFCPIYHHLKKFSQLMTRSCTLNQGNQFLNFCNCNSKNKIFVTDFKKYKFIVIYWNAGCTEHVLKYSYIRTISKIKVSLPSCSKNSFLRLC